MALGAVLASCVSNAPPIDEGGTVVDAGPAKGLGTPGSAETFDVMTWNLKEFPRVGEATLTRVAGILQQLEPDLVAVQEVDAPERLTALAASMPGWQALTARRPESGNDNAYNPPVGFLYNAQTVEIEDTQELFPDDDLPFPRVPLLLQVRWKGVRAVVINVHLKALGDDSLDLGNRWDEEMRRKIACDELHEYLAETWPTEPVIVLGDFNDRLEEPRSTNVFTTLLDRPEEYLFTDLALMQAPSYEDFSYPKQLSHLDHVLITNELFEFFQRTASEVRTVPAEYGMEGGWYEYESYVSDHRPVFLKLDLAER